MASVRLVKDPEGRSKGFGYVEFVDRNDLRTALEGDGAQFKGRSVRIDVAERESLLRGPKFKAFSKLLQSTHIAKDRDGFGRSSQFGGEDRTTGDWRSSAAPSRELPPVRREPSGRDGAREGRGYGFGSRDSLADSPRSPTGRYGSSGSLGRQDSGGKLLSAVFGISLRSNPSESN